MAIALAFIDCGLFFVRLTKIRQELQISWCSFVVQEMIVYTFIFQ